MNGHIVLVGLSGSGKSAVGRILSRTLDCPLYDTDALLAARAGRSVPALLRADATGFRTLEEEIVCDVCAAPAGVIATGGGVVLSERSRVAMRAGNVVVWLQAPIDVLVQRIAGGEERPLVSGEDMAARLTELERERKALYSDCSHITIETGTLSPEIAADAVLQAYRQVETSYV